jgi:hypothetical protein
MSPPASTRSAAARCAFPATSIASFTCGMSVQADNTAYVCGDEHYLEIPVPWKPPPTSASYTIARGRPPRQDAGQAPPASPLRRTHFVDAGADLYGLEATSSPQP